MDMFETIFGDKLMDPVKGLLYRKNILEPGGSIDADVLLRNMMGRDPKPDAFLRHKGIDVST
jgi:thimet oligopeptidase